MWKYAARRLGYMILTLWVVSIVTFVLIQLPPGDFVSHKIAKLEHAGGKVTDAQAAGMRHQYGLDRNMVVQYFEWIRGFVGGDLGRSFQWDQPVSKLLAERLPLTMTLFVASTLLVYAIAVPIGIYSAKNQYTLGDYLGMLMSFLGMSVPGFLLALGLLYVSFRWFGLSPGGLMSPEYVEASWSVAKIGNVAKHLAVPLAVMVIGGTAGLIRVMRANLLDELQKLYVTVARAKGVPEWKLLVKYPVRVAINPIVSSLGFMLPGLISGQAIISMVLNLPTFGPLLLDAVRNEDMYLAGSVILIQTALVVFGVFLSDILLVLVDPRIRLSGGTK